MFRAYRIPGRVLRRLVASVPKSREYGGCLEFDDGDLVGVQTFRGPVCRDRRTGNLLEGGAPCGVTYPTREVTFHTHPRANRPSTADFLNAWRVPMTRLHLVATEQGVWVFRSTSAREPDEDELRFLGHYYQRATQKGEVSGIDEFRDRVRKLGLHTTYLAVDSIPDAQVVEFLVPK